MGPDEFSDPIIIPITLTVPNPNFRRSGRRRGVSHHPSFTDPDWFRRQGVFARPASPPLTPDAKAGSVQPGRCFATVEEFKAIARDARSKGGARPSSAQAPRTGFVTRLVYQDTLVAALPPYSGPPLSPEIKAAFDDLALTAQELANNFYLNHPEMVYASPAAKGTVLHEDFHREVKSMNNPHYRLEYSRKDGEGANRGEVGSVRNDVEYIDPTTKAVLAILDYKTTADPDVTSGDMLSIGIRRTQQIREALTRPGQPIDPSIPIVGMRVFVPPQ